MDELLGHVWGEYRAWAATSRRLKARITRTSASVLGLLLAGTALGTLSPLVNQLVTAPNRTSFWTAMPWLPAVMPWLAAVSLGIATYLTNQLLSESERQSWVKARAVAEALKSEAYKYVTATAPYDTPLAAQLLAGKAGEAARLLPGVLAQLLSAEERVVSMPEGRWSAAEYVQQRAMGQITFYRRSIEMHGRQLSMARTLAVAFGVAAILLSAGIASVGATSSVGLWSAAALGIITTAAASIAAWFQTGHHQQIALNYQAAAARVELLLAQFRSRSLSFAQLVVEAEGVFQTEHAAWLAEWQTTAHKTEPAAAAAPKP